MTDIIPDRGSVIRYAYLWADENPRGQEEGRKDRPALVLALFVKEVGGAINVLVLGVRPWGRTVSGCGIDRRATGRRGKLPHAIGDHVFELDDAIERSGKKRQGIDEFLAEGHDWKFRANALQKSRAMRRRCYRNDDAARLAARYR